MKKWYRIFYIQWDADKGVLTPVISEEIEYKSNWHNTMEEAESILYEILQKNISKRYTILPVYEHE